MKGLELPINMIVIIAIAVLILVVVAAFFSGGFGRDSARIQAQSAWDSVCGRAIGTGCALSEFEPGNLIPGFNPDGNPATPDGTVKEACELLFGIPTTVDRASFCRSKCCGGPIGTP